MQPKAGVSFLPHAEYMEKRPLQVIALNVQSHDLAFNWLVGLCHLANEIIVFWRCRCRRQLVVKLVILDVNVEILTTPFPTFVWKTLKRKRKLLALLLVVQLLGNENDVMKCGKTRERAEKRMMYDAIPHSVINARHIYI